MKYLKIQNNGELDIRLVALMGGSTKSNDRFKIGQFGTGLKYTLAYLFRNNVDFKIYCGESLVNIEVESENIADTDFDIIKINGNRTSITTQMVVQRGETAQEVIDFTMETCHKCSVPFFMPTQLRKKLLSNPGESFYCPNGHGQHYVVKTEAQKIEEQLNDYKKRMESEIEWMQNKMLDSMNEKKALEKQLNRVRNGVCPCCNRTFKQLAAHMKNKHPEHFKS